LSGNPEAPIQALIEKGEAPVEFANFRSRVRGLRRLFLVPLLALACAVTAPDLRAEGAPQVLDLSLLVAPDMPCTWPADWFPPFQINHFRKIGPLSAYNVDILCIDGNTGTQLDFPPHSVPLPDSGLPNASPLGKMFSDKVPAWQFGGEACVIDCRDLCDSPPKGRSDLIKRSRIITWEKKHRNVGPGDVVLFHSGYTDKYYKPLPAGRRFIPDPLDGKAPAWPDPDPDCMEYLATRKVMTLGCDSPSMGPIPDLAEPTHIAGLKYGMIWTEGATGLGQLPATGAFYCCMGPKHAGGPYSEGRALAVVGEPLAGQLIAAARNKDVVDLSVLLSPDLPVWWPGPGSGNQRHPYMKILFSNYKPPVAFQQTHLMDSHTGTHLVPPAYALPAKKFDNQQYAPEVRQWLAEYEQKYGPRGSSDVTADKVPLAQTCGHARVIDVKHLTGTTDKARWPASPEVTVADIQKDEGQHGSLKAGEVVIFHSGYSDSHFKPFPNGNACLADPLNGKSEGWPAPGPDAIAYLAGKGIRCVATDGPTLGGVDPKRALWTYWLLGSKGMAGIEYLTNLGSLPEKAYFVFAGLKVRNCHGAPGRAIAYKL
jgi:kynurenine formamidase